MASKRKKPNRNNSLMDPDGKEDEVQPPPSSAPPTTPDIVDITPPGPPPSTTTPPSSSVSTTADVSSTGSHDLAITQVSAMLAALANHLAEYERAPNASSSEAYKQLATTADRVYQLALIGSDLVSAADLKSQGKLNEVKAKCDSIYGDVAYEEPAICDSVREACRLLSSGKIKGATTIAPPPPATDPKPAVPQVPKFAFKRPVVLPKKPTANNAGYRAPAQAEASASARQERMVDDFLGSQAALTIHD